MCASQQPVTISLFILCSLLKAQRPCSACHVLNKYIPEADLITVKYIQHKLEPHFDGNFTYDPLETEDRWGFDYA